MRTRALRGNLPVKGGVIVKTPDTATVEIGDLVVVEEHRVGEGRRIGEILEVLGTTGHEHYRVRWDDDRESIFYPSNDAIIQPARHRKQK
jgi:rRNA processing protein Gar1